MDPTKNPEFLGTNTFTYVFFDINITYSIQQKIYQSIYHRQNNTVQANWNNIYQRSIFFVIFI